MSRQFDLGTLTLDLLWADQATPGMMGKAGDAETRKEVELGGVDGGHRGRPHFPLIPATSAKIDHRLQIASLPTPPTLLSRTLSLMSLLHFSFRQAIIQR
ncbi:hypothetical protein PAMP_018770 [Pampus punctatissimus]